MSKRNNVQVEDPHIQSRAAYVFLRYKLKMIEVNYWLDYRLKYLSQFEVLKCAYCGRDDLLAETEHKNRIATIDHVKPLAKGGDRYNYDNFVVSCRKCNSLKGDSYVC